jgi:mono/diheme cytochrome c family protein
MKPDRNKGQTIATQPPARSNSADPEPSVAHTSAVPVWLFILFALFLYFAMVYLDKHGGGFNPHVYGPYTSSNQLVKLQPLPPGGEIVAKGRDVYNMPTCVSCHQPNGQGTPGQFPTLVGSEWVLEENPARLIRIILNGLQGPITVKGQPFPPNVMVPWKDNLKDEEIAAVASYVRKSWGNDASIVKKEQVAEIRKETANRNTQWTAEELLKVPVPKK